MQNICSTDSLTSKEVPVKPMHVISKQHPLQRHKTLNHGKERHKPTAYLATILNANLSIIVKCFKTKNTGKHPIADAAFILMSI